jgi:hypothetical protein
LAFDCSEPGQKPYKAAFTARLGPAQTGPAWPGFRLWAGPGTSLSTTSESSRLVGGFLGFQCPAPPASALHRQPLPCTCPAPPPASCRDSLVVSSVSSALHRSLCPPPALHLSDEHGSPAGRFGPTRTHTRQYPHPQLRVRDSRGNGCGFPPHPWVCKPLAGFYYGSRNTL